MTPKPEAELKAWKALGAALCAHAGGSYSWPTRAAPHANDEEYISLHGNAWHLPTIYAAISTEPASVPGDVRREAEQVLFLWQRSQIGIHAAIDRLSALLAAVPVVEGSSSARELSSSASGEGA